MRPACSRRNSPGTSLLELMVATFIIAMISVLAFKVLMDASQYLRLHQEAIDAQRSGLALLSQINAGLQTTRRDLIATGPEGVVFASPFKSDGTVEFDPSNQKLMWQKWICYYRDSTSQQVTRRENALALASSSPGSAPMPATFAGTPVSKAVGTEVAVLQVTQMSATPPVYSVNITVGTMTDPSRYGIELHSDVSPRN